MGAKWRLSQSNGYLTGLAELSGTSVMRNAATGVRKSHTEDLILEITVDIVTFAAWLFVCICAVRFITELWEVLKSRMMKDPY